MITRGGVLVSVVLVAGLAGGCGVAADLRVGQDSDVPMAVAVRFGEPAVVATMNGQVELTVSRPEVVVFHRAEFDATAKSAGKAGSALDPVVRVRVQLRGVSGQVATGTEIQLTYEAPDGTLAGETLPLMTHEPTDPLSSHPTTVSAKQKSAGEVFFDSADAGGSVLAGPGEGRQVVWR